MTLRYRVTGLACGSRKKTEFAPSSPHSGCTNAADSVTRQSRPLVPECGRRDLAEAGLARHWRRGIFARLGRVPGRRASCWYSGTARGLGLSTTLIANGARLRAQMYGEIL